MTTWMRREIDELPARVAGVLATDARDRHQGVADRIARHRPAWAMLVGRGTSDHAATYARYLIETMIGIPVASAAPSVTTVYGAPSRWDGGLVIAISQSGCSPDIVTVTDRARAAGALTVALTNDEASPLASTAEHVLPIGAGRERAVAATKTYVLTLVVLADLVARWAGPVAGGRTGALDALPAAIGATISATDSWLGRTPVVDDLVAADRVLLTSRGYDLATVQEVAIKLKETGGFFADGLSTADLEHGPIALAGPQVPVIVVRPGGAMGAAMAPTLTRLATFGADPWVIDGGGRADGPRTLTLPLVDDLPAALLPIVSVVPGQLLAEAAARGRGRDPDRPAGLTKVTLTH